MRRKKEIKPVEPQSRTEPTTPALEALAKLPENIQQMALGFAYGLEANKRKTA